MSVGDLVLINAYALQVCLPLNALGFVYREARGAWVNAERLFQLLRERPEIADHPALPRLHTSNGGVVFDEVSFHDDPARPILHESASAFRPAAPWPWLDAADRASRPWPGCCCASTIRSAAAS